MDRDKPAIAQCQIGFISVLVKPLYVEMRNLLGEGLQVIPLALVTSDVHPSGQTYLLAYDLVVLLSSARSTTGIAIRLDA
eukprot:5941432-Pleurochrysis_carterae.AAC.2